MIVRCPYRTDDLVGSVIPKWLVSCQADPRLNPLHFCYTLQLRFASMWHTLSNTDSEYCQGLRGMLCVIRPTLAKGQSPCGTPAFGPSNG